MKEIILPWPPVALSPNNTSHYHEKARAKKRYRADSFYCCKIASESSLYKIEHDAGQKLHLWIDFHPARLGRIDADNCLARIKSGIDGIADYLGIDDANFIFHPMVKDKIQGGCVKVRITHGPEAELIL